MLFKPLTLDEIKRIVRLQTALIRQRLAERRIELILTDEAEALVASAGFDPVYGARPLKRYLQHAVETRVGRAIIAGQVPDGSRVSVSVRDGELAIDVAPPAAEPGGNAERVGAGRRGRDGA